MPSKFGGVAVEDAPAATGSRFGGVAVEDAPESHEDTPSLTSDALKYSPVGVIKGLAGALRTAASGKNPFAGSAEENAKLLKKAKDSFQQGDYTGAAAHFLNYIMPGGGQLEDAGEDFQKGEIAHGLAKTAGIASSFVAGAKLPEITSAAGAVADAAPKTGAALLEGAKAAGPDVLAGTAKIGMGSALPKIPGVSFGMEYQGGKQILSGIKKGATAFSEEFNRAAPPMPTSAPLREGPSPAVNSQGQPAAQLPPATTIIPPPPADTSYVRGVPAEYAPSTNPAPAAPAPAIEVTPELLDQVSWAQAKRPFSKLSPLDQRAIRTIAEKLQVSPAANTAAPQVQTQPAAPPVAPQAPAVTPSVAPNSPPPAAAAPVSDLEQQLTDSLQKSAKPAPEFKGNLRDLMRDLSGEQGKAVADANYAGNQDPELAGPTYEAAHRNVKAIKAAEMLHEAGVGVDESAIKLKKLGFSADTIGETIFRLKRMGAK